MGVEINPNKYQNLSMPKAVRVLTREITASIFPGTGNFSLSHS
jgi:hypothetical protein